ncbi:MFS general substrate transporter [Basidiobolus meristosporus CBS 931.73]|uniref:MFS general substrate transporter n=1 Tax=Basidiobolus meristosporus CBS 931.73 TaxID=1314790 RepID=A0A1Y1Y8E0_9FUNG|nr:MFS general substrate transporter [Basidiobolus meristosporus CBS 931.73]|eukprot:ORX94249.1 MFS general substrate transporter [Basidiobolus meristosporus CBS 931.73]
MNESSSTTSNPEAELKRRTLALKHKLDLRLMPFLSLLYFFSFLDRVNIGNARLIHIEDDLNLTSSQYAWVLSVFFIGFIVFDIPSNLVIKRFSPSRWIARIMVSWGAVTMATAGVTNFAGLVAARFFLGVAEAGLFPGLIFYLTFWYTRREQCTRFALFFSSASLAGAFGGALAYGMGRMNGVSKLKGWQWIFLIEGLATILVGIITWFYLPNYPHQAKWLTESERELAEARLSQDFTNLSESKFDRSQFTNAVKSYKTWMYMFMYVGVNTPVYSISLFLPTIVRGLGFSSLTAQLFTCPPYFLAFLFTLATSYHSDRTKERGYHLILQAGVGIVGLVLMSTMTELKARYAAACVAAMGVFSCVPVLLSWVTNNVIGATKAATTSAMVIAFGNCGGLIASQFYRADEAPQYLRSNWLNVCFLSMAILLAFAMKISMKQENKRYDLAEQQGVLIKEVSGNPAFRNIL